MQQNNNFLNFLPEEICEKIYKNVYTHTLKELKQKVNDDVGRKYYKYLNIPKNETVPSCDFFLSLHAEGNSDGIRNRYLKSKYKNIEKKGKGRRNQLDYWKLICDLERPTVWPNSWYVRKHGYPGDSGGGINWNSCYEPSKTSDAGWKRLQIAN
eukprot:SAG11_NODE_3573_length_2359_cov_145.957522_5_plen_154_part_00